MIKIKSNLISKLKQKQIFWNITQHQIDEPTEIVLYLYCHDIKIEIM